MQQLKSDFKKTINCKKYNLKTKSYTTRKVYLDKLIDPSFQGVNRLFVLPFENENNRTSHTEYYLPTVEIKDYNVMIDGRKFFDQPINNDVKTFENIRKLASHYTTGCLLDCPFFKENYKMIVINLSKQQALDADPRAIQQINITGNLGRAERAFMFFIYEEANRTILEFFQGTVKVLWTCCTII